MCPSLRQLGFRKEFCLSYFPRTTYNRPMSFGVPEVLIISASLLLMVFGHHITPKLGIRALTFDRKSDVLIGIGIVTVTLVTFLLLAQ